MNASLARLRDEPEKDSKKYESPTYNTKQNEKRGTHVSKSNEEVGHRVRL